MKRKDLEEFNLYLRACTMRQLHGVFSKEFRAGRFDYSRLATEEIKRREALSSEQREPRTAIERR